MFSLIAHTSTFVARQSLSFRGDWIVNNEGMGSEKNSNFFQLLKLRSEHNPQLVEWLEKKQQKYTSPEI